MKVFLSWSGNQSKAIASVLRRWIEENLQKLDPWMSDVDVQKGKQWSEQIGDALTKTTLGIFCVTRDNISSPWLHYEAGFIAAKGAESCVHVLFAGVGPEDIKSSPLSLYQGTRISKDEILRMFISLDANCTEPIGEIVVSRVFERSWTQLEKDIVDAIGPDERSMANIVLSGGRINSRLSESAGVSSAFVLGLVSQNVTNGEVTFTRAPADAWKKSMDRWKAAARIPGKGLE